jgi:FkbM family methyltransferase
MPSVFAACAAEFPGVVYDVGANTGFYSVLAAAVSKENHVYAFEPFPPVLADLRSTLRVNHCSGRVSIQPVAVGRRREVATLYVPLQDHGLVETSATLSSDFKDEYSAEVEVPVIALDEFRPAASPERVTVIKIDVESTEAEVLAGAHGVLKDQRPVVFCEVLPKGDTAQIDEIRRRVRYVDIRLQPTRALIGGHVVFDDSGWNHLLVPGEKLDQVIELLDRCGLDATHQE